MLRDGLEPPATAQERWERALEYWEDARAEAESSGLADAVSYEDKCARYAIELVERAHLPLALENVPDLLSASMVELLEHGDELGWEVLDEDTLLQLVHEEAAGELYELAERVRKIVALGPEQVERQYEGERIVRELVCRRMRRWNAKHPWVAPPPVWDRGKPGSSRAI